MKITAIAYTGYAAENVPQLLAFYRDVLGLKVDRAHPSEEEAQLVEFDIGNDQWFSLLPEALIGRKPGSGSGIVFEVDDIDAALEKVRGQARTADEKAVDYPGCRTASFEDPEGNRVGLHQTKADV